MRIVRPRRAAAAELARLARIATDAAAIRDAYVAGVVRQMGLDPTAVRMVDDATGELALEEPPAPEPPARRRGRGLVATIHAVAAKVG